MTRTPWPGSSTAPSNGWRLGRATFCGKRESTGEGAAAGISRIYFFDGSETVEIEIAQTLRPDAVAVVNALRARGLDLRILSGDAGVAVAPVARELGIEFWQAGLKPAEKIAHIDALKKAGRRVLMVGDGLNDAPSLAAANVSMSPVSATHLAQAAADAIFLGDRLEPVAAALKLSRRAFTVMKQNLWLAVIYNAIALPVAIAGLVTPLIAAAAMSGSSILVTANALRARAGARQA
jgi:Cu2+-exporting ATPase